MKVGDELAAATLGTGPASPKPCLDIRIRFNPVLPLVRLRGELDISGDHLVQDAVESAAANTNLGASVILDISGVTFCDVAGLRALEDAGAALTRDGRHLVLYDVPESVKRLMAVVGIASRLEMRGA